MKEESQIDDMRAALRGDRERAEQARQTLENVLPLLKEPGEEPQPQSPQRPGLLGRLLGR